MRLYPPAWGPGLRGDRAGYHRRLPAGEGHRGADGLAQAQRDGAISPAWTTPPSGGPTWPMKKLPTPTSRLAAAKMHRQAVRADAAVLLLATIAGRYRLTLLPGQIRAGAFSITIRPKNGLHMRCRRAERAGPCVLCKSDQTGFTGLFWIGFHPNYVNPVQRKSDRDYKIEDPSSNTLCKSYPKGTCHMSERNSTGPAYRIVTSRLVLRCWELADAPLLKAATDMSIEHLRLCPGLRTSRPRSRRRRCCGPSAATSTRPRLRLRDLQPRRDCRARRQRVAHVGWDQARWRSATGFVDAINQGLATEVAAKLDAVVPEVNGVQRVEIYRVTAKRRGAAQAGLPARGALARRVAHGHEQHDEMIWTCLRSSTESPAARRDRALRCVGAAVASPPRRGLIESSDEPVPKLDGRNTGVVQRCSCLSARNWNWLPGWGFPAAESSTALAANPAVAWYLRHKAPEIGGWMASPAQPEAAAERTPAGSTCGGGRRAGTLEDLLVYAPRTRQSMMRSRSSAGTHTS